MHTWANDNQDMQFTVKGILTDVWKDKGTWKLVLGKRWHNLEKHIANIAQKREHYTCFIINPVDKY